VVPGKIVKENTSQASVGKRKMRRERRSQRREEQKKFSWQISTADAVCDSFLLK
jgi:hypothetical protein